MKKKLRTARQEEKLQERFSCDSCVNGEILQRTKGRMREKQLGKKNINCNKTELDTAEGKRKKIITWKKLRMQKEKMQYIIKGDQMGKAAEQGLIKKIHTGVQNFHAFFSKDTRKGGLK